MKPQQTTPTRVQPAMEVYDANWRLLGHVPDRGTVASLAEARQKYGTGAAHMLPTIIEAH